MMCIGILVFCRVVTGRAICFSRSFFECQAWQKNTEDWQLSVEDIPGNLEIFCRFETNFLSSMVRVNLAPQIPDALLSNSAEK